MAALDFHTISFHYAKVGNTDISWRQLRFNRSWEISDDIHRLAVILIRKERLT